MRAAILDASAAARGEGFRNRAAADEIRLTVYAVAQIGLTASL